jgi:hypothetical protein
MVTGTISRSFSDDLRIHVYTARVNGKLIGVYPTPWAAKEAAATRLKIYPHNELLELWVDGKHYRVTKGGNVLPVKKDV